MDRRLDILRLIVAFHNCFENGHNKTKIKYSNTVSTLAESVLLMPSPIRFKNNLVKVTVMAIREFSLLLSVKRACVVLPKVFLGLFVQK